MGTFINNIKKFDKILIFLFVAAVTIGLVFIYSATRSMDNNMKFVIVQGVGILVGIILMYVITCIDYEDLASLWKFFSGLSLFLLILVLIIGIGGESTGTKGWIRFGSIGIQPAEIVKVCFILTLAKHLDTIKDDINYIKNVFLLLCHLAIPLCLILAQPDFGSAMVFVFIFVVMIFVANIDWRYILAGGITGVLVAVVSWFFFFDSYQKNRIYALFNPESAAESYGYHVIQSKIAIGSGQVTGKGLFQGIQTQMGYLPEKHMDFIYSVIGEEGGIIMCMITVLVLMFLILRCIHIARKAKDELGSFICMGVAAMWLFHTFENVGMAIGIMPVTGIPLPFISYGGSSVMTNCMALGLVLNVYMRRKTLHFDSAF
ncbi:MAG: rod shape-determining protein RodA [Clostridia bacterium]|nr:rod shape-determining protein RodA [Clostridia bacterium]